MKSNLVYQIEKGIDLCSRPYQKMAQELHLTEAQVIECLQNEIEKRNVRRFGPIVKHHEFGYRQNAMIVWDVPAKDIDSTAQSLLSYPFVTLCYQRQSINGVWPYQLYCMVHAKDEAELNSYLEIFSKDSQLGHLKKEILVSHRSFKQKGARYRPVAENWREQLLTRLQKGISCSEKPFAEIAKEFDLDESEILAQIRVWLADGTLTRFGPMYNIEKMGGEFTLVAMEVPQENFDQIAEIVNQFNEVAHNYEREHRLNMWFVLACQSKEHTERILKEIESKTGLHCYAMPKEKEFYLNLQLEAK